MKHKLVRIAISVVAVAGVNPAVLADQRLDRGLYLGGGIGFVSINDSDFDDDNNVPHGFVGWQITPNFGIEAGYADFGDYGNSFTSVNTDGVSLAATLRLPITERFAVFGKAGQFWWEADFDVGNFSDNFAGKELFFGVGLSFELTDNLDLRLAYDRLDIDLGSSSPGTIRGDSSGEVDILSAGLKLEF